MIPTSELLTRFKNVRRLSSNSYQCSCPCHKDDKPSLTITAVPNEITPERILLYCHAGCSTENILAAVGLSFSDIGPQKEPPRWRERFDYVIRQQMINQLDYAESGIQYVDEYRYKDQAGKYLYTKTRYEGTNAKTGKHGKEIRYIVVDELNDSFTYLSKTSIPRTLYRLPELLAAVKNGFTVYIVEGEKDVETLRKQGLPATTAGGVKDWKKEYAQYFIGAKVVILPDNDQQGRDLAERIRKDLYWYAYSIKKVFTSDQPKGDVTDYLNDGHTKEDLLKLIQAAPEQLAPWLQRKENQGIRVNTDFLAAAADHCLNYQIVRLPDEDRDCIYLYKDGVYRRSNRNAIKCILKRFLPLGSATDNALNNALNLMLCNDSRIRSFTEMEGSEDYINLRNGLYEIKTGKLLPHDPDYVSMLQLQCVYDEEARSMPAFTRFINDMCTDGNQIDESKRMVIQEWYGFILSNIRGYRAKKCLVLWSILGNTGKTVCLNLLISFLGSESIINIPLQQMNEQSRFALGAAVGKRGIFIGDQTSSEIHDSAVFKQLTGGDPVKIEAKGKQAFFYVFPGVIAIACNNLPSITDDKGGHLFERMTIISLEKSIPAEQRDPFLLEKLEQEKPAIFNWAMEGLNRLIKNGYRFTECEAISRANSEYRDELDTVHRFLSEYYVVTGKDLDTISKTAFDGEYLKWCAENEYKNVNKQNIKRRMAANGCRCNLGNYQDKRGVTVYRGLRKKGTQEAIVTDDFLELEKHEPDPL